MSVSLRARAWATIVAIRDDSVRTLEWRDRMVVHRADGTEITMANYEGRADEFRNLRVIGEQCLLGSQGINCTPLVFSLVNGVSRAVNVEDQVGVVRPETPDVIWPWCVPSPLKGLGHVPSVMEIQSRAERLGALADLRIESETPGGAVVLGGTETHMNRPFRVRIEIDPESGCVQRHQFIDQTWNVVLVDWWVRRWEPNPGAYVPSHVEFRVFEVNLDEVSRASLRDAREHAGITAHAMDPTDPGFAAWASFRDAYFGKQGAPTRLSVDWQSSHADILSVNGHSGPEWFRLPDSEPLRVIYNHALDCEVDRMDLVPTLAPRSAGD